MSDKVRERRDKILGALQLQSIMSVNQLAGQLNVSIETIRKDLAEMVKMDLVTRVHGGVGLTNNSTSNTIEMVYQMNKPQKRTVASAAVELINPGGSIMLEDGSTCFALAQALRYTRPELLSTLTIITNSFNICSLMEMGSLCERLFFLGGLCDSGRKATLGHFAAQQMANFHVQQLFIAPAGISPTLNVVAYTAGDAAFQMEAIRCADEKILMTDKSKFLSSGCLNVAPLDSFDHIVTDMTVSNPLMQQLLRKKLPVYLPRGENAD